MDVVTPTANAFVPSAMGSFSMPTNSMVSTLKSTMTAPLMKPVKSVTTNNVVNVLQAEVNHSRMPITTIQNETMFLFFNQFLSAIHPENRRPSKSAQAKE